jgi:hypothetical protein
MLKKPQTQKQKSKPAETSKKENPKPADKLRRTSKEKDIELSEKELGKVTGGAIYMKWDG